MMRAMQIPPARAATFYWIIAGTALVAFFLGLILAVYIYKSNFEQLYALSAERRAALEAAAAKTKEVSPAQIAAATALTPGNALFGTVTARGSGQFTLTVQVAGVFEGSAAATARVDVPIAANDEIVIVSEAGKTLGTFADIQTGGRALVQVLKDKKIIYITK